MKKLNKEELRALLESPLTARLVKDILESRFETKLPERGMYHVAGQSVMSAIGELANLDINPIYNDIDIFIFMWNTTFNNEDSMKAIRDIQLKRTNTIGEFVEFGIESNAYDHISYLSKISRYKVVHSETKGSINKTYITSYKGYFSGRLFNFADMTKDIIENFDINATQVGFCLDTMKIVYTEDFLDFCINKQLEISHWNTPNHSLIRLMKKSKELGPNVFINFEEAKFLAMTYTGALENLYESSRVKLLARTELTSKDEIYNELTWQTQSLSDLDRLPLFFGKKHRADYLKYLSEEKDIKLRARGSVLSTQEFLPTSKNENSLLTAITPKDRNVFFSKFLESIRNSDIGKSSHADRFIEDLEKIFYKNTASHIKKSISDLGELRKTIVSYVIEQVQLLPYSYRSIKNARSNVTKHYIKMKTEKIKSESKAISINTMTQEIELLNFRDLIDFNSNFTDQYKIMNKVYGQHSISEYLNYLPMKDWLTVAKNINKISKLKNGISIYGILEDRSIRIPNSILKDYASLEKLFYRYFEKNNEQLTTTSLETSINGLDIKTLTTKNELIKEGQEMSHCVGGYSGKVRSNNCIILKVSGKDRFTIELIKNQKTESWELYQIKGKNNQRISWDRAKDAIFEINKTFKVLPMTFNFFKRELLEDSIESSSQAMSLIEKNIIITEQNVDLTNNGIIQCMYQEQQIQQIPIDIYQNGEEMPF